MTHLWAQVDWLAQLENFGLAAFLLGIVLFGLYRFVSFILHKVFDKDGVADRWVADNKAFYASLTERLEILGTGQEKQQEMCERHADLMDTVGNGLEASLSVQNQALGSLNRLVELHEAPSGKVMHSMETTEASHHDIQRVKKSIRHACEMCRIVSQREFPNSAAEVARHCDEIEKAIGEA